jgi:MtN3 and saliva related transmembrane protein
MTNIEILGFTAAFCTTISFLPQAIKVIKSRDTSSLSLAMYSLFTVGVALWLSYGLYLKDWAIITANAITLALAAIILANKIYNDVLKITPQRPRK